MMRDVRFLKVRFHGTKETKPTGTRTQGTDHFQRRSVAFAFADVHHDGDLWGAFRAEGAGSGAKGIGAKGIGAKRQKKSLIEADQGAVKAAARLAVSCLL